MTKTPEGLRCPACGRAYVHSSHRRNAFERLAGFIGLYPFRCQICNHRFWKFAWKAGDAGAIAARNRREYERLPARVMIGIQWGDGQVDGTLRDVSIAGGTVETGAAVPEGVMLQLTLHPSEEGPVIDVSKAVVRSSQEGRLGVQFVDVSEEERARLSRLVQQLFERRS